jgi:chemotaxis protein MotB
MSVKSKNRQQENPYLLSYSDLMAALLLVFILLLTVTMLKLHEELEKRKEDAARISIVKDNIIEELQKAFQEHDILIVVDPETGAIKLDSDVLFESGKDDLRENGKYAINSFMPVYLNVLFNPKFKNEVTQIIVEGHTDPHPQRGRDISRFRNCYAYNLGLSQDRAFNVVRFVLQSDYRKFSEERGLNNLFNYSSDLKSKLSANGRSFSQPLDSLGNRIDNVPYEEIASGRFRLNESNIHSEKCRRVEFKFRLNDEEYLQQIRNVLEGRDKDMF